MRKWLLGIVFFNAYAVAFGAPYTRGSDRRRRLKAAGGIGDKGEA